MERLIVTYGPELTPEIERGLDALGDAIRQSRARSGLSQRALAGRSGVSQSTISRLERGVLLGLRLRKFAALVDALDEIVIVSTCRRARAAGIDARLGEYMHRMEDLDVERWLETGEVAFADVDMGVNRHRGGDIEIDGERRVDEHV